MRQVRLAELVAALSLGIDLGFGQPMEHVLRQCLIALRLAERSGLDEQARATVYYTALLINVACHTDAHEQAKWFGDDIGVKAKKYEFPVGGLAAAVTAMSLIGAGLPPIQRVRLGFEFMRSGRRDASQSFTRHAEMAKRFAHQLGVPAAVQVAVGAAYERWDGRGFPDRLAGEAIPIAARIAQLAEFVEVAYRIGGADGAVAMARKRGTAQFDPALSALVRVHASKLLDGLDALHTWDAVIQAEPALQVMLSEAEFDAALVAIANFVDLKSPYTLGHSPAVAEASPARPVRR